MSVCTTLWTVFDLVRHPEMLMRLRDEIHSVGGSEMIITRARSKNMPYLHAVLNESKSSSSQVACVLATDALHSSEPVSTTPHEYQIYGEDFTFTQEMPSRRRIYSIRLKAYRHHIGLCHMHRRKELFGEAAPHYRPARWPHRKLNNI
jgi:hypothetical protein